MKDLVSKRGLDQLFHIESVATSNEEIGNDVYPPARRILNKKGIPCPHRHARRIRRDDLIAYDFLICMDDRNLSNMRASFGDEAQKKTCKLMEFAGMDADVADPWYSGDFESCYEDIVAGCEALLDALLDHVSEIEETPCELHEDAEGHNRRNAMSSAEYLRRVDEELAAGRFASQSK